MVNVWQAQALRSAFSVVLCYATLCAISLSVDFEHFTWWSLASSAIWFFINGFYPVTGATYFFLFISIQLCVVAGVLIMGLADCDVFHDSHKENGSLKYIFGNYAMHYLPSFAAILLVDKNTVLTLPPRFVCFVSSIAVGVYFAWSFFQNPLEVYGCTHLFLTTAAIPFSASVFVFLIIGGYLVLTLRLV